MDSGHHSKRMHRAKSEMTQRRTSMESIKIDFRNKFLDRLRKTRSRSVDRFRHLVESYEHEMEYKSISELKHALLSDQEATALINTEDVSELLQEIENEMRQVSLEYEAESYAKVSENETEDAIERLMGTCEMCRGQSVEAICSKCNAQLSSEFK